MTYQFKARAKTAAQDEVGESAQSKRQEAALAAAKKKKGKKKVANKNTMRAAAVAMAKKSNKTGNPGAKAAALKRVARGK